MMAVSLAFLMAFSALSANIASIVKLLEANAATASDGTVHDEADYYESNLTLYDYHTNKQLTSGINQNDGNKATGQANGRYYNEYSIFNRALIGSGYVGNANRTGGTFANDYAEIIDTFHLPKHASIL